MLPTPLSNEWGANFLQIIGTLLIFALGVQLSAKEVNKVAARRGHDRMKWLFWMMALYALAAIAFVWLFPPIRQKSPHTEDWVVAALATVMLGATVVLVGSQVRYSAQSHLIERLVHDGVRVFRRKSCLPDGLVKDLLDLASLATTPRETEAVLGGMRHILREVRRLKNYHGEGLDQLLCGVETVARTSDEASVGFGAQILSEALQLVESAPSGTKDLHWAIPWTATGRVRLRRRSSTYAPQAPDRSGAPTYDMVTAMWALVRLGETAAARVPDTVVITAFLQKLSGIETIPRSRAARGLFLIGRKAIAERRAALAVTALNHLESAVSSLEESCVKLECVKEVQASYFGLVVHISTRSESARTVLLARPIVARFLATSPPAQFQYFVDFFAEESDFETADLLTAWIERTTPPAGPASKPPNTRAKKK